MSVQIEFTPEEVKARSPVEKHMNTGKQLPGLQG